MFLQLKVHIQIGGYDELQAAMVDPLLQEEAHGFNT